MKIKEFFRKLFGCKEEAQPVHESSAVIEPAVKEETVCPAQECGVTTTVSSVEAPVKKPRKKRGRPRKKKKEE